MAENDKDRKTEPATPKRRQEAREKGQVAQSSEVNTVFVLLSTLTVFYFLGNNMLVKMEELMHGLLSISNHKEMIKMDFYNYMLFTMNKVAIILIPIFAAVVISGILAQIIQVGFVYTFEPLKPKISKISPIQGIKRLFSKKALQNLLKSVLKIIGLSICAFIAVKGEIKTIPSLIYTNAYQLVEYIGTISFRVFKYTIGLFVIVAVLDYIFVRREYENDLKMTKEEVKEEFKQREGDPLIKGKIRSVQRELAKKRMLSEVPKADVVITNPTTLAVAILYNPEKNDAPQVVAKGKGFLAERIKEVARKNNVPIMENKPLARTLFKIVEVGMEVPPSLYKAVAEVLAYIYRIKGKLRNL
ncbi:MAG: flagellar biosynthesis protein FlhB [Candidatus Schekmanbacteria bacterium]|nr:MAG: flagellar biosynthesis protein FlhB [Candidatus Schekmanbacteria bacterium]